MTINLLGADRSACIDAYMSAGAILFPLTQSKTPAEAGWQHLTETCDPLPECYGYLIPKDVFVLDYDPRLESPNHKDQLAKFTGETDVPPTFTVETPRGGVHLYYKFPPGWELRLPGRVTGFKAVEIKQHGQLVAAAGSESFFGVYKVIHGDPSNITIAPDSLLEYIRPRPGVAPEAVIDIEFDTELSKKWYIEYLRTVSVEESAYIVACRGKDKGLTAPTIALLMFDHLNPRWSNPASIDVLQAKANNAYRFGQNVAGSRARGTNDFKGVDIQALGLEKKGAGGIKWDWEMKNGVHVMRPNMNNVICYFQLPEIRVEDSSEYKPNPIHGLIAYNVLSHKLEFLRPAPWHQSHESILHWRDVDTLLLKDWFYHSQHFRITRFPIEEAIEVVAHQNQFHPIRGWLERCEKNWDGNARIDMHFTDICGAFDNKYVQGVAQCFFIGAVARIMEPGCKHDTMVVLEGKTGIGKSTYISELGGKFAGAMTLDPMNPQRNLHRMLGKWIIEIPEMEFTRWTEADVSAIKAFLSIAEDYDYLRYEKHAKTLPRQSLFVGTMNPNERGYLRDVTGNRRFHPIRIRFVDLDRLRDEREQLFGEAMHRWRQREPHHFTDPEIIYQSTLEQQSRQFTDLWEDVIAVGLAERTDKPMWFNSEIAQQILHMSVSRADQKVLHRISNVMVKLGYVQVDIYSQKFRRNVKMWARETGLARLF